jgi:hypothetical protein
MRSIVPGLGLALSCAGVLSLTACNSTTSEAASGVYVDDVARFVDAWGEFSLSDSSCTALRSYWESGGPGLETYRRKFKVSFEDLCTAVHRAPDGYEQIASRRSEFDSVAAVIGEVYSRFHRLRPLENNPSVFLVVGSGISAGSTTGGRNPSILLGMERNRSSAGLPWLVAHELVHTQQRYPLLGAMTGGPRFLRGTVLRHSIAEGAADFIAELITGGTVQNEYAETREGRLWQQFRKDASSKVYGRWLYNGGRGDRPGDIPPDLGYWVGYRITKSYYEKATDKRGALDAILSISDFEAFLRDSGYQGADTLHIR